MRNRLILFLLLALLLAGCNAPVRVTWKTETEMNTAGFNLYRGTSPNGPFDVKVNEQLIPSSSDPLTGKEYSYLDKTAQGGITYYYELQEVERDGKINRFGPISVRAGGLLPLQSGVATGLQPLQVAVLVGLTLLVLLIWIVGGRLRQKARRDDG